MRIETITCDGCGRDLTYTGNRVDYRLALTNERRAIHPDVHVVTAMGKYPAIAHDAYFCGLKCLDRWRDHGRLYDRLMKEHSDKWAAEKGTTHEGVLGCAPMRSYPVPPDDVSAAWMAECRAAADAEFPLKATVKAA